MVFCDAGECCRNPDDAVPAPFEGLRLQRPAGSGACQGSCRLGFVTIFLPIFCELPRHVRRVMSVPGAHFGEGLVRAILAMLARQGALCVAPGGCAPVFSCVARHGLCIVRPGRESRRVGRTGKLVGEAAAWIAVSRSGLSVTAAIGVQSRVAPLQRRGLDWRARW